MAAIPDSIKIKLEVDATELDIAIEKMEKLIKLQQKSLCAPIPVDMRHGSSRADYVSYMMNKNNK